MTKRWCQINPRPQINLSTLNEHWERRMSYSGKVYLSFSFIPPPPVGGRCSFVCLVLSSVDWRPFSVSQHPACTDWRLLSSVRWQPLFVSWGPSFVCCNSSSSVGWRPSLVCECPSFVGLRTFFVCCNWACTEVGSLFS